MKSETEIQELKNANDNKALFADLFESAPPAALKFLTKNWNTTSGKAMLEQLLRKEPPANLETLSVSEHVELRELIKQKSVGDSNRKGVPTLPPDHTVEAEISHTETRNYSVQSEGTITVDLVNLLIELYDDYPDWFDIDYEALADHLQLPSGDEAREEVELGNVSNEDILQFASSDQNIELGEYSTHILDYDTCFEIDEELMDIVDRDDVEYTANVSINSLLSEIQ